MGPEQKVWGCVLQGISVRKMVETVQGKKKMSRKKLRKTDC